MSILVKPNNTANSVALDVGTQSGATVTGLVAATFPSVVIAKLGANGYAAYTLTLSNLASLTAAWTNGGVFEVASTGRYRVDFSDNGLSGLITISSPTNGTQGYVICESLLITDTTSTFFGVNTLKAAGSDVSFTGSTLTIGGSQLKVNATLINSATVPANFAALNITSGGLVALGTSQGSITFSAITVSGVLLLSNDLQIAGNMITGGAVSIQGGVAVTGNIIASGTMSDAGGPIRGGAGIGGAYSLTLNFKDTSGNLITASPFVATITNGVLSENHTASNFTTSLSSGTFGITAYAPGYQFTPTTMTVTGAGTFNFTLTPITHTDPTPQAGQVLASGKARDGGGGPKAGVVIGYRIMSMPDGEKGNAFQSPPQYVTSDSSGNFSMAVWGGATYLLNVDGGPWNSEQTVPSSAFNWDDFR